MAERKVGTVVYWHNIPPVLAIFRLMPQEASQFPDYKAGQYIALRRDDCKLTKKIGVRPDGTPLFGPDLDENGNQKVGPTTHSYSISSAPYETRERGYLEFYVILEQNEEGHPGRLTESLFRMNPQGDNKITYVDRITGDFTLEKRASGFKSVILIGTGTGLAPFASVVKQLHNDASNGRTDSVKYTLLYTNRTYQELAYHQELKDIEASQRFDFLYVPSVSRPTQRDLDDPRMGRGRANNMLRHILGMPLKEEQELQEVSTAGGDISRAKASLEKTVKPVLPSHISLKQLQERFDPNAAVIMTCGNPFSMADIRQVSEANRIRFEYEEW